MQAHQLRVAVIIIALLIVIFFGITLVRRNTTTPNPVVVPEVKASSATEQRHVAFNPVVQVIHETEAQPETFRHEYRTKQSTRARKRQAAADKSAGCFQESEMFARMAHAAPFMPPLSSQSEFQQTTIGEHIR